MKPCFGYIRVSTQKQGEGVSLEAQKDAIAVFASQNDLTITQWFEEKETAAKSGRPVFNQMLRQLKQGKAQGLIMHKIDRSARNLRDWSMVSELPKYGVKPYFAADGLDMETRGGRLSANLQAVIAEDYIHNLREECIKGLRGRLKQGLYPFRAPIGYLDNGRGQPKTPCPEKAPLIKLLFELYLSGAHSITSLHAEMGQRGLKNHEGNSISRGSIEAILSNPFYAGVIRSKRNKALYDGIHEPLITMRQFQRVQDIKAGKAGKKVTKHNHLYRGLFRCADCNGSMTPERQKGTIYYRCHTKACPKNTIREDQLDAAVIAAYQNLQMTELDKSRTRKALEAWLNTGEQRGLLSSLDLRIAKAQERKQRLTDLLIDGSIDRDAHSERSNSLTLELATLQEERDELAQNDLSNADLEKFFELQSSLAELHISLNPDEKRQMFQNCFSNCRVQANQPLLEPYSWLSPREIREVSCSVHQLESLLELLKKKDEGGPGAMNVPESRS